VLTILFFTTHQQTFEKSRRKKMKFADMRAIVFDLIELAIFPIEGGKVKERKSDARQVSPSIGCTYSKVSFCFKRERLSLVYVRCNAIYMVNFQYSQQPLFIYREKFSRWEEKSFVSYCAEQWLFIFCFAITHKEL